MKLKQGKVLYLVVCILLHMLPFIYYLLRKLDSQAAYDVYSHTMFDTLRLIYFVFFIFGILLAVFILLYLKNEKGCIWKPIAGITCIVAYISYCYFMDPSGWEIILYHESPLLFIVILLAMWVVLFFYGLHNRKTLLGQF